MHVVVFAIKPAASRTTVPFFLFLIDIAIPLYSKYRHCHVNRGGPQRSASMPIQAAALALSHTLKASALNRLNISLLSK